MAKLLSQEEIDALLSDVSGESQAKSPTKPNRKTPKFSPYDFKHPNLVSKEQLRLLENIHEGVCRNFGVYLSAQLRMFVEMSMLAVDQIQYSEFVMSIAPPSCIYTCEIDEPYSKMVLELSPELTIFIVERLFGGRGEFVAQARTVSVIEQRIMKRVIERANNEICKNWQPVIDFGCKIVNFDSNPEFVQVVPSNEPVIVVSMEIKIHGKSTLMNICYPYMWVSSIISSPEVQEKILFGARKITDREKGIVEKNLYKTPLVLKAILGKSKLSIREFLSLRENDVIKLDNSTDAPVSVYVNKYEMFKAAFGVRKRKFSIRISSLEYGKKKE